MCQVNGFESLTARGRLFMQMWCLFYRNVATKCTEAVHLSLSTVDHQIYFPSLLSGLLVMPLEKVVEGFLKCSPHQGRLDFNLFSACHFSTTRHIIITSELAILFVTRLAA